MSALFSLLDYFPLSWIRRWLKRPKTVCSFDAKSHDQLITEFWSLDEVSAKYFYFQILNEMKSAIDSDDETNVIRLNRLLNSVGNVLSNEELKNYHQSLKMSDRSVNFIILACKSKAINVLKYLLSEKNIFLFRFLAKIDENLFFPGYEDDECHNAIYYAIRSNSTVLLEILIEQWPGDYFGNNPDELDTLLSGGYRELKLKNVHITKDMEIFIQSKILDLRFFHVDQNEESENSTSHIIQRIDLVLENIKFIRTEFWNSEPDEKFVLVATFIAKNIHLLKSQLKSTYGVVPWEEIEFCLIIYIHYCLNQTEISFVYRVILSKMKILVHLGNFSNCLNSAKEKIRKTSITKHAKGLSVRRNEVLQEIIAKTPSFESLYEDYTLVRDFYSLTKIKSYIDIALSCNATEREGQLIITRALQVLGEHVKNTLYSPKMSDESAENLLGSLQSNTKDIVMNLRDSLSHAKSLALRSEIENYEDSFFVNILIDLTNIKIEITNIIYRNKILAIRELLSAMAECKDLVLQGTLLPINHSTFQSVNNELIETLSETPLNSETELLEELVSDFKKLLEGSMTNYEKTLFDNINQAIQREKTKFQVVKSRCEQDIFVLLNVLFIKRREFVYFNPLDTTLWIKNYISENFKVDTSNSNLKEIETLYLSILLSIKPRMKSPNYEMEKNIRKFVSIFPGCKKKIKWLEEFRDILFKNEVSHLRIIEKSHKFDAKMKELLFNKRSQLQNILVENNLNANGVENLLSCKKESKQQILIEMLVLDIMAILGDSIPSLTHNPFFLDDDFCMPIGKNLRNHLAHGNTLNYILSGEDCTTVLLNARKITTEDLLRNERKIGKRVKLDLVRTKNIHIKDLSNVKNQQKMFLSFSEGNTEEVKECIKKGADIHGKDRNLWTVLHFAAKGPSIECIKLSLTVIPDGDARDINGQSALHIATVFKRRDIIEYLITEVKMYVDDKDAFGKTSLHIASENGWTEGVQTLVKYKASITLKDFFGFSALHLAILKNNFDVALILLEMESNVDGNEAFGSMTALHLAAKVGNVCLLNTLLERNADVTRKSCHHFTPLHFAVESGNLEIVKYLIERRIDIDAIDRFGNTPLYYAVRNCNGAVLSPPYGSAKNMISDGDNFISTSSVVHSEYLNIVKILVKNEANVNKKNNAGSTPLHLAVETGCLELVKLLLRNKALVDSEDKNKITALHASVAFGHKNILMAIIEAGGNIHSPDVNGLTPLHKAIKREDIHIVKALIDRGVDINATDINGRTALHMSTVRKHNEIVKLLLKNKANTSIVDCFGLTPFYVSIANGMSELYLVEDIDINFTDVDGYTPLHIAATYGDEKLVKYCINKSCNVNAQCLRGFTALHFAVEDRQLKIVQLLLENGSNINAKAQDGRTALHLAIANNCENIVKILLKSEAERQHDIAHIATQKGYVNILEILSQFNDFDINRRVEKLSLLDIAISCSHINVVKYLLEKGFNINSEMDGSTALHTASYFDNHEIAKLLLSKGSRPNIQPIDFSPLHIASFKGYTQVVDILLKGGANVLVKDHHEKLAIEYAVEHNHLRVLELLLKEKDIDINFFTKDGFTLLHIAAEIGSLPVVKCLIRNGAKIISSASDMKPVHIAAVANHRSVVEYFLDLTFCINEPGKDGKTLLHLTIFFNHPAIFELLIKRGADVNVYDANGSSPIYLAALEGRRDFFNTLLSNGAFYNSRKKIDQSISNNREKLDSLTLMQVAKDKNIVASLVYIKHLFTKIKRNDVPGIESTLKKGTSFPNGICINAISAKKTTLLHYAAWKGYEEVVNVLLKHKANPNVRGKHGSLPLHYAVKFSHIGIVKMLLSSGALYNNLTDGNRTPRYYAVDQDIICLLDILHESFKKIEKGDSSVVDDLQKIKDVHTAKAVMRAKNKSGRTLIGVSIVANHPKIKCLKELFQEDVLNNLQRASILTEEGYFDEALSAYKKVLERRIEIFSVADPGVLDIQQKIAVLLCKRKKYEEALNLLLEVQRNVETLKEIYTSDDVRTLKSKISAIQDIVGGKLELDGLDEIFIQQKEMLGLYDINVLTTQLRMATALEKEDKFDDALKLIEEVIENSCRCTDDDSTLILFQSLSNKARIWHKLGKFKESVKIMNYIRFEIEETLDPHHPVILLVLSDLFLIFYKQGEYEESLKLLHQILDSQKASLGRNHINTLITQLQKADVHFKLGQYSEALRIYQKNLSKVTAILGEDDPKIRKAICKVHLINSLFGPLGSNKPVSVVQTLSLCEDIMKPIPD
ncbi:ankyrin-3 [Trichonephila clavata]|uniref:Alpha-latrotoxin n=1 Tax=Trichonephila clavata TaxID=2740835 RepID=A0A8X6LXB9_TRICU|nr:ankyrin-3 [Trichonephila clavata]